MTELTDAVGRMVENLAAKRAKRPMLLDFIYGAGFGRGSIGERFMEDPAQSAAAVASAPFTAAPDLVGLAQLGLNEAARQTPGMMFPGAELPQDFKMFGDPISGDPIRELFGVDPESRTAMAAEMLSPVGTMGKAATAAGKVIANAPDLLAQGVKIAGNAVDQVSPFLAGLAAKAQAFLHATPSPRKFLEEMEVPFTTNIRDIFDEKFFGTDAGEGALSFGWGINMAENPKVSGTYAANFELAGRPAFILESEIDDDVVARMLDWDAPLSEQPESVRRALERYALPQELAGDPTGSEIYKFWSPPGASYGDITQEMVSQHLNELGIPGVRYFDQQSRELGEGTRNITLFSPDDISQVKLGDDIIYARPPKKTVEDAMETFRANRSGIKPTTSGVGKYPVKAPFEGAETKRLYNASTVDFAPSSNPMFPDSQWLDPHVSAWVDEVAGGTGYEGNIADITTDLLYLGDEPTGWIESIVGRKVGKNNPTLEDVRKHGRLNIIDADMDSDIYKVGDYSETQEVTNLYGDRLKFWESNIYDEGNVYTGEGRLVDMPVGPEPDDFITKDSVDVSYSLTGDELVDFIKENDPKLYERLASRTPTTSGVGRFTYRLPKDDSGELIDIGKYEYNLDVASPPAESTSLKFTPKAGWSERVPAPKEDGVIYRGMSEAEYKSFLETGEIKSQGRMNIGKAQEGLTYFSTSADNASGYATGVSTFDKNAKGYVVAIRDPGTAVNVHGTSHLEKGIPGTVTKDQVVGVYEGVPSSWAEGSDIVHAFWRRIDKPTTSGKGLLGGSTTSGVLANEGRGPVVGRDGSLLARARLGDKGDFASVGEYNPETNTIGFERDFWKNLSSDERLAYLRHEEGHAFHLTNLEDPEQINKIALKHKDAIREHLNSENALSGVDLTHASNFAYEDQIGEVFADFWRDYRLGADLDHWRNLSPEMTDDFIRIIDEGKRKAVKPTTSGVDVAQDLGEATGLLGPKTEFETVFRGESTASEGGNFFSPDPEFAQQFTQRGLLSEVKEARIRTDDIYDATDVFAGDPDAVDAAIEKARQLNKKAVRLSEGADGSGQLPPSVFVFDKSAIIKPDKVEDVAQDLGEAAGLLGKSEVKTSLLDTPTVRPNLLDDIPAPDGSVVKIRDRSDFFGEPVFELDELVIPEGQRGSGAGSDVMREITKRADEQGATIILNADSSVSGIKGSKAADRRLIEFYKRHGFFENRGRNIDFRFGGPTQKNTMVRVPTPPRPVDPIKKIK